jgi:hypothetical protein
MRIGLIDGWVFKDDKVEEWHRFKSGTGSMASRIVLVLSTLLVAWMLIQ